MNLNREVFSIICTCPRGGPLECWLWEDSLLTFLLSWTCIGNWDFDCILSGGCLRRTWCFMWWSNIFSFGFSQSSWFSNVFNRSEHCFSFNWIENTLSDTGIHYFHRWIIRRRDESARFRVWHIFFRYLYKNENVWFCTSFPNLSIPSGTQD